ncbi:U-box domain-containing protein 38-like [Impatiens glandulifera]|uniref:U-box domain-containing protein 38-like n=1 Tax=Impatiens glandulifera TaxID=253017 RepID=UPI001FB18A3F|nr:U-box domain-containing protein 38-like [Impatiens glandulifera]
MGGNGKHRWKISIHKSSSSSSSSKQEIKEPPEEFFCPISESLLYDPVVVSSGQTFERAIVKVCKDLGFSPILPDGSKSDFSTVIPNLALKTSIRRWCDSCNHQYPLEPDSLSTLDLVRSLMASSERDLLKGVAEKAPATKLFTHAATELNPRKHHLYSSSSEESVIANLPETPLLPFTTRPVCYSSSEESVIANIPATPPFRTRPVSFSSSSSHSTASDIDLDEVMNCSSEDEEFVAMMKSTVVYDQEQVVIKLRNMTRSKEESRISLCTHKLLSALRPLLLSKYSTVQTNAVAAVVNLSLEKKNKVKIVRSGIVPPLIDLLKGRSSESQEHAAGALFSLALDDNNKTAIGVLGGLQPLLYALRSESERTRHDSAMALYHLSLVQSNRVKLVKFGTITTLLSIAGSSSDMASRSLLVLCNMAMCPEGRSAMLDAGAVEFLMGLLRKGNNGSVSESSRENCVAALFSLSQGSLRFKGLMAKEPRATEILREVAERGSERGKEKANRILKLLRGRVVVDEGDYDDGDDDGDSEPDWEGVMANGLTQGGRYKVGVRNNGIAGPNSSVF